MSQWDFGYGREPTEHHEPQYPQQPPYPYPEQQEPEYPYAQEPQGPQYPAQQEPEYPYPQEPPYPYPYAQQPEGPGGAAYFSENAGWTGSAGRPDDAGWSYDAGQPADAAWSADTGWPDVDGRPGPGGSYEPPAEYPITYERDEFEGRASLPVAFQPGVAPPHSPWPDAPDRPTASMGNRPRTGGAHRLRSVSAGPRTGRWPSIRVSGGDTQTAPPTAARVALATRERRPGRAGNGAADRGRRATRRNGTMTGPASDGG